jgi:hypothetical protein
MSDDHDVKPKQAGQPADSPVGVSRRAGGGRDDAALAQR